MANSKLQKATGINWKVRFSNPQFLVRTAVGIFLPALAYLGVNYELALQSWGGLIEVLQMLISSPMALGIIALNVINLIPDPTHKNILDTKYILNRDSANVSRDAYPKKVVETPNATMEEQMDEYEAMQEEEKLKK